MAGPKGLTPPQQEIFEWVKAFIGQHGIPRTVREMGAASGIDPASSLLKAVGPKGCLRRGVLGTRSLIMKGSRGGGSSSPTPGTSHEE